MHFRVTESFPAPPGGYQIYAWPRSNNDDVDLQHLRASAPIQSWCPASSGWLTWVPSPEVQTLADHLQAIIHRTSSPFTSWQVRESQLTWGDKTHVMAVLNVTPDSFSDGGQFDSVERAIDQATYAIKRGADIIDIGGESSRPGADPVTLEEELNRTIPVIRALRELSDIPISIDTTKSAVLESAFAAGADILNDISAGLLDAEMLPTAASLEVPVILMHMQGTPRTMQSNPSYTNVFDDVYAHLAERISVAESLGIPRQKIAIDPGIGFGKTVEHNLTLIQQCGQFRSLGCPLLMGVSRKSFIGKLLNRSEPQERVWGTGAACAISITQGADIIRVHDIAAMSDIRDISDALIR